MRLLGHRAPRGAKPGSGEGPGGPGAGAQGSGRPSGAVGRACASAARPQAGGGVALARAHSRGLAGSGPIAERKTVWEGGGEEAQGGRCQPQARKGFRVRGVMDRVRLAFPWACFYMGGGRED